MKTITENNISLKDSEQDELRKLLANELGARICSDSSVAPIGSLLDMQDKQPILLQASDVNTIIGLIRQREQALLDEVEKAHKLLQDPYKGKNNAMSVAYRRGAQDAHDVWHNTIQAIRKERGL